MKNKLKFSTPVTTTAATGGNSISIMKGCRSVSFPAIKNDLLASIITKHSSNNTIG